MMEVDYEIVYRPGRVHQVPDALSRFLQPESDEDNEVDDEIPTYHEKVQDIDAMVQVVPRDR